MAQAKLKKLSFQGVCGYCLAPEGSVKAPQLSACARCGLVVYCSKDCQRAHWKSDHKQHCVAKADRVPQQQGSLDARNDDNASRAAAAGEKCSICLDPLTEALAASLECKHVFDVTCVTELRRLGVKQACPLCRTPLPPGPEMLYEESALRFMAVYKLVMRGKATWSTLPSNAQQELDAAVAGCRAAADQGLAEAQFTLGRFFEDGRGVPQNFVEAVRWCKKAAEQGHAEAQCFLGVRFKNGEGVEQSDVKSVHWYKKAAEQGHMEAQYYLGSMFDGGNGVAQSDTETVRWWLKAAEQGHVVAQYNIGKYFRDGRGVAQNDAEAVRWWLKAASQGFVDAQHNLGVSFKMGCGVAQSDAEAVRWWKKAAMQGLAEAQCYLGRMYFAGTGVARSEAEAVRWWKKAAKQGHARAQYYLQPHD